MMKLYYSPMACSLAVQITLKEYNIPARLIKVDIKTHKVEDGSDFYEVNPDGSVPVLELENGYKFTQTLAILLYLSSLKPKNSLTQKAESLEYYNIINKLNFISSEIHKSVPVFLAGSAAGAYLDYVKDNLLKKFSYIDSVLAKQTYFGYDEYSLADIYLFVVVNWFSAEWNKYSCNLPLDLTSFTNIEEWHGRLCERKNIQSALSESGPLF